LAELVTLDQAALERFATELIVAGFEPVADSDRRCWQGPISSAFTGLTSATTMRLLLRDGWPFRHPHLQVSGLNVEHVNDEGLVCLWQEDDNSRTWMYLDGVMSRIESWCERARVGFRQADHALDAYIGFTTTVAILAEFDLDVLKPTGMRDGQSGRLHGIQRHPSLIELRPGTGPAGSYRGQWLHAGEFAPPPRNLDELRSLLTSAQNGGLNKSISRVASGGEAEVALIIGRRHDRRDTLVLRLCPDEAGRVRVESLEPAPTDCATLALRAGPDAAELGTKRVLCFGLGAIGSHVALLLSESGVGQLHLVDGELLRPGNVVRHAAGRDADGLPKVCAVETAIRAHAPWTSIAVTNKVVWDTPTFTELMKGEDLVIDTTGASPIVEILSRIAEQTGVSLISASLYRGGAVGRVRRQLPGSDTSIYLRGEDERYTVIPSGSDHDGDLEAKLLEPGCSSPINNAPPSAVAALSALAAQVAIDALTGRMRYSDEVIDAYEPLDEPPFDRFGRVERN
jgi:molybdopterin/thiamine biosynthesis adenylyltransferase